MKDSKRNRRNQEREAARKAGYGNHKRTYTTHNPAMCAPYSIITEGMDGNEIHAVLAAHFNKDAK